MFVFFFFSSRRRHTRCSRDWSSDVCSSDLATLVKALEEKGIGRPSTYASILSVIQNRDYVEKQQGRFYPTELGMLVSDLLVKNFRDIFDVAYTARMEEELDEVEDGTLAWTDALGEFYKKFKKDLRSEERRVGKECRSRWSPYH